jgi:hypothetical protein
MFYGTENLFVVLQFIHNAFSFLLSPSFFHATCHDMRDSPCTIHFTAVQIVDFTIFNEKVGDFILTNAILGDKILTIQAESTIF